MKIMMIAISSLLLSLTLPAQDIYVCKDGTISFFSEAPLEDIDATSRQAVSAMNIKTGKLVFKIPIKTFAFDKALMQEHFNEKENYMHSAKYPYAKFSGTIVEEVDLGKTGTYEVTVKGTLTIKGVAKEREIHSILTVKEDGTISGESEFTVKVEEHNIEIPKLLFKNIAEEVLVKVNAVYKPKKDDKS